MRVGDYSVDAFIFGSLRLDGGAMFGSVPKNLWNRLIPADLENCIPLVSRSLLLRGNDKVILIDLGCGDKWDDKRRKIYAFQNTSTDLLTFRADEITDVILTHLHFDHAGGLTTWDSTGRPNLTYPNAAIFLQRANLEIAKNPSAREQGSYLPENVAPLTKAKLTLLDGDAEPFPGIKTHRIDGHSMGQQWIEICGQGGPIFFATDLIPTAHHIPLPYIMGYDMCPRQSILDRQVFLNRAVQENALVVFQHDRDTVAARIAIDTKGNFALKETFSSL